MIIMAKIYDSFLATQLQIHWPASSTQTLLVNFFGARFVSDKEELKSIGTVPVSQTVRLGGRDATPYSWACSIANWTLDSQSSFSYLIFMDWVEQRDSSYLDENKTKKAIERLSTTSDSPGTRTLSLFSLELPSSAHGFPYRDPMRWLDRRA